MTINPDFLYYAHMWYLGVCWVGGIILGTFFCVFVAFLIDYGVDFIFDKPYKNPWWALGLQKKWPKFFKVYDGGTICNMVLAPLAAVLFWPLTVVVVGYFLPLLILRKMRRLTKPKKTCLLPACKNLTTPGSRYCCFDHWGEHNQ